MRRGRRRTVATGPHQSTCWRCDERIEFRGDAVKRRGHWYHRTCTSGADDE